MEADDCGRQLDPKKFIEALSIDYALRKLQVPSGACWLAGATTTESPAMS
jgi:hypothetical protein